MPNRGLCAQPSLAVPSQEEPHWSQSNSACQVSSHVIQCAVHLLLQICYDCSFGSESLALDVTSCQPDLLRFATSLILAAVAVFVSLLSLCSSTKPCTKTALSILHTVEGQLSVCSCPTLQLFRIDDAQLPRLKPAMTATQHAPQSQSGSWCGWCAAARQ